MELSPRQTELADVALRILATEGMAAVSFRSVAAGSGWSLGAVQNAYASKAELVAAMFARMREVAAPLPPGEPGRPTLVGWLTELFVTVLPLDDARRATQLQSAAFGDQAMFDPTTAAALSGSDAEIRGLIGALIRRAQGEGELARTVDPDAAARGVLVLLQGFCTQLLYDPLPETDARRLAGTWLRALLPSAG